MSNLQTLATTILVNFTIVRIPTLEQGYRAFFDRIGGGGPDGSRLHFFCRDAEAVSVLHDVGVGACGPGYAVTFDAEQFVMHTARSTGAYWASRHVIWMVGLGAVKRSTMSSYSSKLYPNCADGLLAKTRFCDSIWR